MLIWVFLKVKSFKTTTYKKAEVYYFSFFMLIDNILNWLPACNIEHNALIDLGKNDHILGKVWYILSSELPNKRELIEDIVRQNIKRKKEKIDER